MTQTSSQDNNPDNALVAVGERVNHNDDLRQRKLRELAAAFNRMGSDSDGEAHTAFDRARALTQELALSFDGIYRGHHDTDELRDANTKLGRQLRQALQENAKYRSMNFLHRAKLRLGETLRAAYYTLCYAAPLLVIAYLYEMGFVRAMGVAILVAPVGMYNLAKGLVKRSFPRLAFGSALLLASIIGFLTSADQDSPIAHRQLAQMIDDMNRDHEFGPKTLYIPYPLSNATLVSTVYGYKDTAKVTVDGVSTPLEISCAKYYDNSIIVPNSRLDSLQAPEKPDIFHRVPAATFGPCDLYAQIANLH